MQFNFNSFKVIPSVYEGAYLVARGFRNEYALPVQKDRHDNFRPEFVMHDYIHGRLGLTTSKTDEAVVDLLMVNLCDWTCWPEVKEKGDSIRVDFEEVNTEEGLDTFRRLYPILN